jgi:hypothetical protein
MAKSKKMKLPINEVLGVVAGAVAAGFVSKLVNDKMPNTPGYIKALIPIGAGIFLTGNKNAIIKGAGFGMVAKGGAELASTLIPGIGNIDEVFLSAPADQSILSLPADMSVLSGDDEFMNGDDEFMNGDDEFMNGDDEFMSQMEEVEI